MADSVPVSQAIAISSAMLLFLFNLNRALEAHTAEEVDDDYHESLFPCLAEGNHSFTEFDQTTSAAIHHMRLFSVFAIFGDDLGYWVKPRSTTWFSRFLVEQYDDDRWLTNFKMTKRVVFTLAEILKPHRVVAHYGPRVLHVTMHGVRAFFN
jgi:hypothetical protein